MIPLLLIISMLAFVLVRLAPGGVFARLFRRDTIKVNSLHGQGILELGRRVIAEGIAEDSTIEAIRIEGASDFALGVQWHAEYDPATNPINRALFEAFGAAVRARASGDLRGRQAAE